jgi:hypothetical protein
MFGLSCLCYSIRNEMVIGGLIGSIIWTVMTLVNILKYHIIRMEINALPQANMREVPTFNYLHMFDSDKLKRIMEKLPTALTHNILIDRLIREARCEYLNVYKHNQYRKRNNTALTIQHRREAIQLNRLLYGIFELCNTQLVINDEHVERKSGG